MLNRRRFLTASAAGLVAAPAIVRGQNLNSKLQIAAIGCDGKGWSDTKEMSTHTGVKHVAFCDVDLARTSQARMLNTEAPVLQDYREMLAKFGPTIDAVTVSTADHAHAKITLDAMAAGKHVYCQKPLTHNVWEARQVRLGAAKSGVITRMGNQIHSHTFYRTAVRAIQDGVIGKVKRVHSWCAATGHGKSGYIDRPEPPQTPPDSVNWDLWIAGAPMRPYGAERCYHPWGWRDWQDFGNGALGDFGCHILDPAFTALKITGAPLDLKADHTGMNDEVWPAQSQVDYTFPGTDLTTDRTLKITWYDGGRLPTAKDSHIPDTTALPRQGSIFIGEKGTLVLPHTGALRLYPEKQYADVTIEPAEDLNHYHGWVDGCLTGKQPSDGFDYAGPLTEAVLLGNIAVRLRGETLTWDAAALKITSHEAANKWLTREYRPGWEIAPVA
jgi:predicted dehydrogenase